MREFFGRIFQVGDDLSHNRYVGSISWILHRTTGLLLVLYIFLHFYSIGSAQGGQASFNSVLSEYSSLIFRLLEYALVMTVVYHMANGLRVMAVDFLGLTRQQRYLFWIVAGIFVIVLVYSAFFFIPRIVSPPRVI